MEKLQLIYIDHSLIAITLLFYLNYKKPIFIHWDAKLFTKLSLYDPLIISNSSLLNLSLIIILLISYFHKT